MNLFHTISILLIGIPLARNASGSSYSNKVSKPVLHIIAADNCPDADECPNRLYNTTIKMLERNVIVMNSEFVMKKRLYKPKGVAEFFKCRDRSANNCESFIRAPLNKICDFFNAEGQFWTPLFQAFEPRFPCPDILPLIPTRFNGENTTRTLCKFTFGFEIFLHETFQNSIGGFQGTYRLVNGTFDPNEFLKLFNNLPKTDLYDYYWKGTLEFYYKSQRTTCIYYVMKLNKVRV